MKFRLVLSILIALFVFTSIAVIQADDHRAAGLDGSPSGSSSTKEIRNWELTGPWGGDVRSMVCSPDNADLLYLGTSDGQLFRSTDAASTWRRLRPGLGKAGLSVDSIAVDPRNTKTMYVGAWAVSQAAESGVYKSEDGGEHWRLLDQTRSLSVRSLALGPSDSALLLAGTANDDPNLNGVYRSTDSGKSWGRISPAGDKEIRNIASLAVDPKNTDIIYAGTFHLPWKTLDGGKTWKQTGYQGNGFIDDSDIFGISVNATNSNLVYMNACSGIYRSTSAGEKWAKIPGIPFSARRTYALLPHPSDPNVIFAGTSEGLWRSKDGGKRWMLLTSKNVVIRAIVIHADNPKRVLIATDDFGVELSDNLGDDFKPVNVGFIHRHILAILPDGTQHGRILASVFNDGTAGSVFVSSDDGESWENSSRGLGQRDVYSFYQAPDGTQAIYAATNAGVFKSVDHGGNWSFVGGPKKEELPTAKSKVRSTGRTSASAKGSKAAIGKYAQAASVQRKRPSQRAKAKKEPPPPEPTGPPLFELSRQVDAITSFVDSEGRSGLLAATMDGLFMTMDETRGWQRIPLPDYDSAGRVFSISTHKDSPKTVYVGTRDGLFISRDGCSTWEHVSRGPSGVSVKAIAQDPRDPNLVVVGTNYVVFRSTNGGRSWSARGGGLSPGDYTAVTFNPLNPSEVMVTDYSRGGIYRSTDSGYSWVRIDDSQLPTSRIWTVIFDPFERDKAYAGSFSSGVYVLTTERRAGSKE
ncbi:MAG: hypothetical protein DMF61_09570 [Blastocatellia bacterium AA13]|nr:MAG: hypothetical protein DMF61_09570 [Blastocatellia bacterium AA13]